MPTYVACDAYDTAICNVAYVGKDRQTAITSLEYDAATLEQVAKFGKSLAIGKLLVYVRGTLAEEYSVNVCKGFRGETQYYITLVKS